MLNPTQANLLQQTICFLDHHSRLLNVYVDSKFRENIRMDLCYLENSSTIQGLKDFFIYQQSPQLIEKHLSQIASYNSQNGLSLHYGEFLCSILEWLKECVEINELKNRDLIYQAWAINTNDYCNMLIKLAQKAKAKKLPLKGLTHSAIHQAPAL